MTRGVHWLAKEEARVHVGPVGATALLDLVGEDEAMEKKASATGSDWRRRRGRQRGRELREKGMVYKGGPVVPGDCKNRD